MLSPALTQLFERARTRFGVDIEILDSSLNSSYPEVETDLQRDSNRYEHRGQSTWEQIKSAVRDAWDRVTGSR